MPNNILIEMDLAGAEWVVVAYLSGDANMLDIIQNKKDPHTVTGMLISGAPEHIVMEESKLVGHNTDPNIINEVRYSATIFLASDSAISFSRANLRYRML